MSREIKFRAWDKKWGKMLLPEEWAMPRIQLDGSLYNDYGDQLVGSDYILEQYTGLKDKNGKEIYEGDIVKMPEWQVKPKYEVVKYCKAGFEPFQEGCWDCLKPDGEEVEVIGNIHENPELLEGKE